MNKLSSRERFITALNHEEPDRIPIDLGGLCTTIRTVEYYQRVKEQLGVAAGAKVKQIIDGHIVPDEEVLEHLGVDTRWIRPNPPKSWKRTKLDERTIVDDWGVPWTKPDSTLYATMTANPIKEPTLDALEKHTWPDPHDMSRYEGLRQQAEHLYKNTPYAIVADMVVTGAGIFDMAWHLRGMDNLFVDILENEDFLVPFLDKLEQLYIDFYTNYMQAVGDYIQMVVYCADLSSQDGPFISPAMYQKHFKPRQKRIFDTIKNYTEARLCVHTCGSVYALLPDYVEIGVEVINPVQTTAKNMEPERLKGEFGDSLSFHGGVDTQKFLPYATLEQIDTEVERLIGIFGKGGGFLAASCHTIQPDVPPQSTAALFQAFSGHGSYPL